MKSFPISHQRNLQQQIRPLLLEEQTDPVILSVEDQSYVVKFERREPSRTWLEWLGSLACRIVFKVKVRPKDLRAGGIDHEAQRLIQLAELQLAVPALYFQTDHYIIMEHCGESLEHRLRRTPDAQDLLYAIVDELIALHQAKQWHGGAQIRNLTIKDDTIYRIDFEENTGNAMPLAVAQAYDVLLCFNSLATHLQENIALGTDLLCHYLRTAPNPQILVILQRVDRYLSILRKPLPLFGKKLQQGKDVRQTLFFADVLKAALAQITPNATN